MIDRRRAVELLRRGGCETTADDFVSRDLVVTRLEFFGASVDVWCEQADVTDLHFFFARHRATSMGPSDATVVLAARGRFFESFVGKTKTRKAIAVAEHCADGTQVKSWTFTEWSDRPSPLPPFAIRSLREHLNIAPGCVLESPRGEGVLLTGANYAGKTSVALELLDRGWSLVSDHLLILERARGVAKQYLSPMGFRLETLDVRRAQLAAVDTRTTISSVTGPVVLARPQDLYPSQLAQDVMIRRVFELQRSGENGARVASLPTPALRTFPRGRADEIGFHLPRDATSITANYSLDSAVIADHVAAACGA